MSERSKRGLIFIGLVLLPFILGLLVTFEIIKIRFPTNMANQPWNDFLEPPILLPPGGAVPIQGTSRILDTFLSNPVPDDYVSIQRGEVLYNLHCALCHGERGRGDGSLAKYYSDRPPTDLSTPYITAQFDGLLFNSVSFGIGKMPPMSENLLIRERWDVINYIRTFEGKNESP